MCLTARCVHPQAASGGGSEPPCSSDDQERRRRAVARDFHMIGILASIIDGVLVGSVYGLAAMGLTLIWGVMNVINLAHGAIIVLGMFVLYSLVTVLGLPPYGAIPVVIAARLRLRRRAVLDRACTA